MTFDVSDYITQQRERIRLLSDTSIYRLSISFVNNHQEILKVNNQQLNGLLEFSRSWGELKKFVTHQRARDWASRTEYKDFYDKIDQTLKDLYRDVKQEYGLVPSNLTNNETKRLTEYFAGLLGREFVEHLVAHVMYTKGIHND